MFGFHFWQALFEGKRWARYRGGLEAAALLRICGAKILLLSLAP